MKRKSFKRRSFKRKGYKTKKGYAVRIKRYGASRGGIRL